MKVYGIFCADEIKITSVRIHNLLGIIDNPTEETFMDPAVLPKNIAPSLAPHIPKPLPQEISDLFGQQPDGSARITHDKHEWFREVLRDITIFKRAPIITDKVEVLLNNYKAQLKNLEGKTTTPYSLIPWVVCPPIGFSIRLMTGGKGFAYHDIALTATEVPKEFKVVWWGYAPLAVTIDKESDSQVRIYLKPTQKFLKESARVSEEQGRQMPAWRSFKMLLATVTYEIPNLAK